MNYKVLITGIFAGVLMIIAASVLMGISKREVTVVDHPYEDGLKYDATQKKYSDMGWKVVVPPSLKKDGKLDVCVYDRNGSPLDVTAVEFSVNRIDSPEVVKYRAVRADHGRYGAAVDFSSKGLWEIKVNLTQGGDTLSYDSRINIEG
jgi:nitrogen fixation protein FixH